MAPGLLPLLASLAFATAAGAHPGHGAPALESSPLHYLLEPEHVFVLAAVALAALALARRRSAARRRAP
jgi:hypothetical protein